MTLITEGVTGLLIGTIVMVALLLILPPLAA